MKVVNKIFLKIPLSTIAVILAKQQKKIGNLRNKSKIYSLYLFIRGRFITSVKHKGCQFMAEGGCTGVRAGDFLNRHHSQSLVTLNNKKKKETGLLRHLREK